MNAAKKAKKQLNAEGEILAQLWPFLSRGEWITSFSVWELQQTDEG